MPKVRIDVIENGVPSATITIPTWMARSISKFLPGDSCDGLRSQIDASKIEELLKSPGADGTLIEIEDQRDKDKITISLVADGA